MSTQIQNAMPPSYRDVIREQRELEDSHFRLRFFRIGFIIANIMITLLTMGGFLIVRFTDTFRFRASNVTKHCHDPSYNISPVPQPSYAIAHAVILMTFVVCIAMILITNNRKKYDKKTLVKKISWYIWIVALHLMFLIILIEFLKCAAGTPRPYFFSVQNITNLYCGKESNEHLVVSTSLENLNNEHRRSFPSYRSAIYGFFITFTIFYTDHFLTSSEVNGIQQLVIVAAGAFLTYVQLRSWEDGENHLSDILVGTIIGMIQGMITIRDVFGSVFGSNNLEQIMPSVR